MSTQRQRIGIIVVRWFAITIMVGCGRQVSPEVPPPPGGYLQTKVTYEESVKICLPSSPRPSDATLVQIAHFDFLKPPTSPLSVELPAAIAKNTQLSVEGTLQVAVPVNAAGFVTVDCFTVRKITARDPTTQQSVTRESKANVGRGVGIASGGVDGKMTYRILLNAPEHRGNYLFEVRCLHQPTSLIPRLIAEGKLRVPK